MRTQLWHLPGQVCVCVCVCLRSCILACKWNHFSERRIFILGGCACRCVHMCIWELTIAEAVNLLCIFVCQIVSVEKGVFVFVCACARILALCMCCAYKPPHPSSSDSGVFLHRCYFSRPTVILKCFSTECFSKQSSVVPQATFYKGPLPHWGLMRCVWSADQWRGVECVRVCEWRDSERGVKGGTWIPFIV